MADALHARRAKPWTAPGWCWRAWATTTICAASPSATRARLRAWRVARPSSITPPPRPTSPANSDIAGKQGLHFIDAPVSGGQSGAQNGKLTIMCGGDTAAFERCAATLRHYAAAVTLIGGTGAGQLAKMVNQICIAGMVQGLSEAIHFGENAGLDMARVLEVIGKGAAASWQMENRGKTMIEGKFDYGFAVDWMRKDLGFCLDEAKRVGVSLPVTALVDQFYGDVQALGGNRYDTSSLIWRLRKLTPAG
jgi:3-hydroxyisobutyrate dehydrogenase-like beta-hydroxyacid dehydrogenase